LEKGIESKYDKEVMDLSKASRIGMNKKYSIRWRDLSKVTLLDEGEREWFYQVVRRKVGNYVNTWF